MIHKDGTLVVIPQRIGNSLSFFGAKHNAAIVGVDGVRVVEVADVLAEHIQWAGKNTPCASCIRVEVADGMGIVRSSFVNGRVNQIASSVGGSTSITSRDPPGLDVETNHIAGGQTAEVTAEWIHPHQTLMLGIANRDVARHAFCVALACHVTKHRSHVCEDVLSLLHKA